MTILEQLVAATEKRVAADKKKAPPQPSVSPLGAFAFEDALRQAGMSFICEVKKASPSKGLIAPQFPYLQIAKDYEAAGAAAISILTETDFFLGSDRYLQEIRAAVSIPLLRKDFIIDPYQITQSRLLGADAILLIVRILSPQQLRDYIKLADSYGLSCLVEAHDAAEIDLALRAGARIIGVNNRDLSHFTVDLQNSIRLRRCVPEDVLFVAESGIDSAEAIESLRQHRIDAVLVGEALMRAECKAEMLAELRGDIP